MLLRELGAMVLLCSVAACAGVPVGSSGGLAPAAGAANASSASYLAAANASRQQNRFAEALEIYQEILVADPKSVAAQYGVAECLLGLGKAGDARPMFEALTQNAEFHAAAVQGKGLALLVQGQREEASRLLREATEADPTLWRSWNGLGLLADLQRQPQEAEKAYSRALAVNPDAAVLHNNLGYSRLLAGKPDEAMTELRKAYALDPESETIQNNIRIALAAQGSYAAAVRGVSRDRMATVLNNVGYIAMQRGDLAAAEGYLARAMESSPSFNTVASQNVEQLKAKKEGEQ